MRLLIVTQKVDVNDAILGFFHHWLEKLAEKTELVVITNFLGRHNLPNNVEIYSLGKERNKGRWYKFFRYQYLFLKFLSKVNGIFFHMCPEYVIAVGLWPKIFRKKSILWYVHVSVNWKLKLAERLVSKIFTASKGSFRLKSSKVIITGHGIDIEKFKIQNEFKNLNRKFNIIYVGRISEIKNQKTLIKAIDILVNQNNFKNLKVDLIGNPITAKDQIYLKSLKNLIHEFNLEGYVNFLGSVPNKDIVKYYQEADLSINLCPTGGLDKTVLESMACGLLIIIFNKNFLEILKDYQDKLILNNKNEKELTEKIIKIFELKREERKKISIFLRKQVIQYHNLNNLINKIINEFQKIKS